MTSNEEFDKYFNAAVECFSNKDYKGEKIYFIKAIEGLTKAIDLDANDKDVYRRRGLTYLSIGDYSKAIDDFTKAIELGANDKDIYDMRGFAYLRIKDFAKAMEDYTKAIELGANDKDVYFKRGLAYFGMDNYPKAISDCTKAIESGVNDKVIYKIRGSAYEYIKNYPKAIDDFTKAIDLGAHDVLIYKNRGIAYIGIGNYLKAIDDFTEGIRFGENEGFFYGSRGFSYIYIGDYAKARQDFAQAIALGQNDKSVYQNRGIAYIGLGNYAKAIKDFDKVVELDEYHKRAYENRGIAYIGTKNYIKAIDDFTKVIELGETDKTIYRNRGIAYIGANDYQKAIRDFKKVIKLNKNNREKRDDSAYISNEIKLTSNILKEIKLTNGIKNKIELTDDIIDLIYYLLKNNEAKVLPDDETLNLIQLVYYCYDLMDKIKIEPSEVEGEVAGEQFVHYTKAGTLQYLLKKDHSAKLRLNNAVYMNDPEEGQVLKKVLCQLDQNNELENLLKDTEDIKNYTYLTCFSPYDKRDELPMWIHYGDGGKGVGLVFHDSFFKGTDLYKVQYIDVKNFDIRKLDRKVRKKIRIILNLLRKDEVKNNTNKEFKDYVNIILNYVSYLFKDKAYEYENEVRILNYRDYDSEDIKTDDVGRDIPRLYIEYKQCITDKNCVEVIVGPKANYTEIAAYAKYVGIQKVSQSEIKYR